MNDTLSGFFLESYNVFDVLFLIFFWCFVVLTLVCYRLLYNAIPCSITRKKITGKQFVICPLCKMEMVCMVLNKEWVCKCGAELLRYQIYNEKLRKFEDVSNINI